MSGCPLLGCLSLSGMAVTQWDGYHTMGWLSHSVFSEASQENWHSVNICFPLHIVFSLELCIHVQFSRHAVFSTVYTFLAVGNEFYL